MTNPDYQVDAFVDQLDRNGATIKSYTLRGVFPTTIAPIELTYDEGTAIEEFAVASHINTLKQTLLLNT